MNNEKTHKQLLMELAYILKDSPRDKDQYSELRENTREEHVFSFTPSKEELVKLLGRKKIWNLTLLKPFVDILKYRTSSETPTILPISTNSGLWKAIYRKTQYVSRLLALAREIGLIECVDSTYTWRFGAKCRVYAWNKAVEKILLGLFKEWDIVVRESVAWAPYNYAVEVAEAFRKEPEKKIRLVEANRRFNIKVTDRTCLPLDDDTLLAALIQRYPQVLEMWKTMAEDNSTMPMDERDISDFNMRRDRNGNVRSISLRKTNHYCSAKAWDVKEEDWQSERLVREKVLMEKFGGIHENDVKSSIYRITYLLNRGEWLDQSVDLYEEIYGGKFATKEERDAFKSPLCMYLYFCRSAKDARQKACWGRSEVKAWDSSYGAFSVLQKAQDGLLRAVGRSYGSEIFLHESCIYTQVAHRIRQMGFRLIQIYDGFYTDRELDRGVFERIVEEESVKYYRKWA